MITFSVSIPLMYTFTLLLIGFLVRIFSKNQAKNYQRKSLLLFDQSEILNENSTEEKVNAVENQNIHQHCFPSMSSPRVANEDSGCSCQVWHEFTQHFDESIIENKESFIFK